MFCYCSGGLCPREPSVSRVSPVLHPELCLQRHQAEGGSTGYGPHLRITANGIHAPRPQLVERTVNPTLPAPRTHPTATPRGCAPRVPSEPVQRQRYLSLSQLTHFSPTPQPPQPQTLSYSQESTKSEKHLPHLWNKLHSTPRATEHRNQAPLQLPAQAQSGSERPPTF